MTLLWPRALVTFGAPPERIAEVRLAFTLYLRDPFFWCTDGIVRLHDAVLASSGGRDLALWRTSARRGWHTLSRDELAQLRHTLPSRSGRPRHQLQVQLHDRAPIPHAGYTYREVSASSATTGFAQWVLPAGGTPDQVWELAKWIAEALPIWSAVAGFVMLFDPEAEDTAFDHGFRLSQRYLGMDLQHPERFARLARAGLPSVNWITMLGAPLAQSSRPERSLAALRRTDVDVYLGANGTVAVRAGTEPSLGDVNQMEYPDTMAAVTHALQAQLAADAPPFPGRFVDEDRDLTGQWVRRLLGTEWAR